MLSSKPWRSETVILFGVALFSCLCLGVVANAALQKLGVAGFSAPDSFGPILLTTLSFQGAACVLMVVFLRLHHVRIGDGIGFRGPQALRALLLAWATIVVMLPVVWWVQTQSVSILTELGYEPQSQAPVALLQKADSLWLRVYLGAFAVILAPVAEEFIFRGVLYPWVKQFGFPRLAVGVVSFLFALIHLDLPTFAPLFVLALALTWLYEATDNLLAPIVAHALFNGVNLVVLMLSELDMLPLAK